MKKTLFATTLLLALGAQAEQQVAKIGMKQLVTPDAFGQKVEAWKGRAELTGIGYEGENGMGQKRVEPGMSYEEAAKAYVDQQTWYRKDAAKRDAEQRARGGPRIAYDPDPEVRINIAYLQGERRDLMNISLDPDVKSVMLLGQPKPEEPNGPGSLPLPFNMYFNAPVEVK